MSTIVYDGNGNPVSTPGLSSEGQVVDASGTTINPSREDGNLAAIKSQTDKLTFIGSDLQTTASVDVTIAEVGVNDATDVRINPAKEDGNLASIKTNTDKLDVNLSTRASEVTVASIDSNLASVDGKLNSLGQKAAAGSIPVVIASDQIVQLLPGTTSTSNSTTTPLGSSATFTGGWEDVSNFSVITVSVISDQNSATNGLVFQWSGDGVNVDRTEASGLTGGAQGRAFSISVRAKYFRVIYTNDVAAQGVFRLNTVLKQVGHGHISKPLDQNVTDENFAEVTQSAIMGRMLDGVYRNVGAVWSPGNEVAFQVVSHNRQAYEATNGRIYSVSTQVNCPSNGVETSLLLIRNPIGSGKKIYLTDSIFHSNTAAQAVRAGLYYSPTILLEGVPETISNHKVAAGVPASSMTAFTVPTTTSNGTRLRQFNTGQGNQSASIQIDWRMAVIVDPGFDLLITGTPSANNVPLTISLSWLETT